MFSRTSFGASDEELERATLSSPHSFVSVDTNESHGKHAFSNKRPRKSVSEELRPPQRLKVDPPSAMHDESSQLACPFAKHNPLRHRRCFKYKMDQISRLKQHLFRVHQVPIHCVRCSQTFSCEDERDAHLRSIPGCTIQPDKTWIGINETQKTQLTQRVSSKKSKEENWYSVYEILFPGSPRPESPYLDGTQFSEELFALREYAMREAPTRIAKLASALQKDSPFPPVPSAYKLRSEAFAFAAVKDTFDAVIDKWLRGGLPAAHLEHVSPPMRATKLKAAPSTSYNGTTNTTSTSNPLYVDPRQTSYKPQPTTSQAQQGRTSGALDDSLPSAPEGTKTWTGMEELSGLDWSGLDWLSLVADKESKSWDEYLIPPLDSTLHQPLK